MNNNKENYKLMIYGGFAVLGGALGAIYGFTANRFQTGEIFLLLIGGGIAGAALGLICNGIIASLKK